VVTDERMPYAPYPGPAGTAVAAPPGPVPSMHGTGPWFLGRANLGVLIDLLHEDERTVIGPTVADGAIVYAEITSADELPAGIGEEQSPGHYDLVRHRDRRVFDYTVGPTSPKRWTFPRSCRSTSAAATARRHVRTGGHRPAAARLPWRPRLRAGRARIQDRVFWAGRTRTRTTGGAVATRS